MEIPSEKVVVVGDSAGGHLALSFLTDLHLHHTTTEDPKHPGENVKKPGGLVLLSPWLSLHGTREPHLNHDVLTASFLRNTASHFLGSAREDPDLDETNPLLEFMNPQPPADWNAVLPDWMYVTAGSNEIMFADIGSWTQMLKPSLRSERGAKERMGWMWGEGKVHDWQWLETIDAMAQKAFLGKVGDCEDFEGVTMVGRAVGERVVAFSGTKRR